MNVFDTEVLEYNGKVEASEIASVYQVTDPKTNHRYLISRVLPGGDLADQKINLSLMFHDLSLIHEKPHPGIEKVVAFGNDADGPYYVREYFDRTLSRNIFGEKVFTEQQFRSIAKSVLSGLQHAHDLGIQHRRIDPDAFSLVDSDSKFPSAFLMRFGLRYIWDREVFFQEGGVDQEVGNVYFAAPELLRGEKIDFRSDLYSLGCVLFYLVTGYYSIYEKGYANVVRCHLEGKVESLARARPDLSRELSQWMGQLMAVNISERFQSAQEAIIALDNQFSERKNISATPNENTLRSLVISASFSEERVGKSNLSNFNSAPPFRARSLNQQQSKKAKRFSLLKRGILIGAVFSVMAASLLILSGNKKETEKVSLTTLSEKVKEASPEIYAKSLEVKSKLGDSVLAPKVDLPDFSSYPLQLPSQELKRIRQFVNTADLIVIKGIEGVSGPQNSNFSYNIYLGNQRLVDFRLDVRFGCSIVTFGLQREKEGAHFLLQEGDQFGDDFHPDNNAVVVLKNGEHLQHFDISKLVFFKARPRPVNGENPTNKRTVVVALEFRDDNKNKVYDWDQDSIRIVAAMVGRKAETSDVTKMAEQMGLKDYRVK